MRHLAIEFMRASGHRSREVRMLLCTSHLEAHGASEARAARTAVKAMGEAESRDWRGAHLDLDRSTSHAIFLRDQNGNVFAFTSATLLELRHMHGIPIPR